MQRCNRSINRIRERRINCEYYKYFTIDNFSCIDTKIMDQKMLDMYKKMVSRYKSKKKHVSKKDYDDVHDHNTESNDANYERE